MSQIAPEDGGLERLGVAEDDRPLVAGLSARAALSAALAAAAVAAVAIPALTLRLVDLHTLGFNSDEAVYAGQAAGIVGDPALAPLFPVFRAHPLVFQLLTALIYQTGVNDLAPRLLAVAFGIGTVAAAYAVGAKIYGRRAGLLAALFTAVMPYLVVVNRQALLDGPMVFFTVLALWLVAVFVVDERKSALYAAGALLGVAFLTKETAIVLVPAVYAFLAITPRVRVRLRDLGISLACFAVVGLAYPLSQTLAGGSSTGRRFLIWQLFRQPNHSWSFYPTVVPIALGVPLVILAVGALILAGVIRDWSWRESLLVSWIVVPFLFFQLWPTKGFQYLLPIAVPVAVLAAGLLTDLGRRRPLWLAGVRHGGGIKVAIAAVAAIWLAGMSWLSITGAGSNTFLAGTGGVPGGRDAGAWVSGNAPAGAEMLAIGPSMANILQFYGHRRVLGISVSPNPLHRNPAYAPVVNADALLRRGDVQYLVWDAYSAARSSYFAHKLMGYVRRYHGTVAHTESVTVSTSGGHVTKPVIVIYRVRP